MSISFSSGQDWKLGKAGSVRRLAMVDMVFEDDTGFRECTCVRGATTGLNEEYWMCTR